MKEEELSLGYVRSWVVPQPHSLFPTNDIVSEVRLYDGQYMQLKKEVEDYMKAFEPQPRCPLFRRSFRAAPYLRPLLRPSSFLTPHSFQFFIRCQLSSCCQGDSTAKKT